MPNKESPAPPELEIILSDKIKETMAADPDLAAALREMFAVFHQAHAGVEAGKYLSFEDAVEAITGNWPERLGGEFEDDLDD